MQFAPNTEIFRRKKSTIYTNDKLPLNIAEFFIQTFFWSKRKTLKPADIFEHNGLQFLP